MSTVKKVPVLVIGTGISGLFTALKLAEYNLSVLLVTKSSLDENNSRYAQGGIAAVLPENMEDSLELHVQDTLRAGAGLCDEVATRSLLAEGYPAILDLLAYGVPFDRKADEQLDLSHEAAHSRRRILHAGGDATGQSVEMTLIEKVRNNPRIEVMEHCQALQLLTREGRCYGCLAVSLQTKQEWRFLAPAVVLATGGLGQLYSHTTNPTIATGDGLALAHEAGAPLAGMEFVQFHPTAFYAEGKVQFLISEALRGEGGLLRDAAGFAFAQQYHPDAELAPRDVLTRAIYAELQAQQVSHVFLDITHLPPHTIEKRFPTILSNCLRFGVDIRKDPIPVAPAAHYMMGGVQVDPQGKTPLEGLYAVGEVAHTGLHGANRLASNSLLECVVLARRVAAEINTSGIQALLPSVERLDEEGQAEISVANLTFEPFSLLEGCFTQLRRLMWEQVGIIRHKEVLEQALSEMLILENDLYSQVQLQGGALQVPEGIEYRNQLQVAKLIVKAALLRSESRGAHYREDFPEESSPQLSGFPQYALAANR